MIPATVIFAKYQQCHLINTIDYPVRRNNAGYDRKLGNERLR